MTNYKSVQEIMEKLAAPGPTERRQRERAKALNQSAHSDPNEKPAAPAPPAAPVAPTGQSNRQEQSPTSIHNNMELVKEMQQAILNFANTVAAVEAFKMTPVGTGKQESDAGAYLGGDDPFSSFLFRNYLDTPDVKKPGMQYVSVDLPHGPRKDTATPQAEADSLRGWVSTMQRVGSRNTGGENVPDGKWGERTTNALKAVLAFSRAMLKFASDIGVIRGNYTNRIDKLEELIPRNTGKGLVQATGATIASITSHVNALTNIFSKFKSTVLDNEKWSGMMSQNAPIFKNEAALKSVDLTPEEKAMQSKMGGEPIKAGYMYVTLNDLASPEAFKEFVSKLNMKTEDQHVRGSETYLLKALEEVEKMLKEGQ